MVKIIKNIVKNTKSTYGFNNKKKYITIHETDNASKGANAIAHGKLQQNGFSSSWHYSVDDKQIVQSFDHSAQCWHAGDGRGPGNLDSIGIEMCVNSDSDFFKTVDNTIWLVNKIMDEEGLTANDVVQHNHWSGKNCPRRLRSGSHGVSWGQFVGRIKGNEGTGAKPPTAKPTPKPTQTKIWRNYVSGKIVRDLQQELNRQFNKGLAVDGYFGDNTINALVNVRTGARGNLTRIIQERLNAKGYKVSRDGIFGAGTERAVKQFQSKSNLSVDGIVGKKTWEKLYSK